MFHLHSPIDLFPITKFATFAVFIGIAVTPSISQTPVWQDDFNNPDWNSGWATSSTFSTWTAVEADGWLRINEVAPAKGKGRFHMEVDVPVQSGQLAMALRLSCSRRDSLAADRTTEFTLKDSAGFALATFALEIDNFTWTAGGITHSALFNRYGPHTALIQLSRNEAGQWKYSVISPFLSDSGNLGIAPGSVSQIHIDAIGGDQSNVGRFPTSRTTVELDFIELYGSRGPRLTATINNGATGDYHIYCDGFPSGGGGALLYGFVGGQTLAPPGPCAGIVVPMANAKVHQAFDADNTGTAYFDLLAPPAAIGRVRIVAVDLSACLFSNVITLF
ncbi:MAG: hypothetical protein HQ519_16490 [Planctomycetes bacterium]|nr:hypothetical protein [Planctomycetota bacterium]